MAASGTTDVSVTSWDTLRFYWEESSQNIAGNYTYINWSLQLISGQYGRISSSASTSWSVTINGVTSSGTNSVAIGNNTTKTLASGTTWMYHNADGTKVFSYSFSQSFDITFSGSYIGIKSGSGTGTLTNIPRHAKATYAGAWRNGVWVDGFYDTENPTIYYDNPAGTAIEGLQVAISSLDETSAYVGVKWRDVPKDGSYYTFALTDAERDWLRSITTTSDSRTVWFYLWSSIGGTEQYTYIPATFTVTDCEPTLDPTVIDVGTHSTELTGNSDIMIRGYNAIQVSIGAAAKKGASVTGQWFKNNGIWYDADTTVHYTNDNTFVFQVNDSRGKTTTTTITKTVIEYIPLTCNLTTQTELTGAETKTAKITFTISGNYFNGTFGAEDNYLRVRYRYKQNGYEFYKWVEVTPDISGNSYSVTETIDVDDYNNVYTIEAWADDQIYNTNNGNAKTATKVVSIVPVFDWDTDDFNFNVPVHCSNGFTYSVSNASSKSLTIPRVLSGTKVINPEGSTLFKFMSMDEIKSLFESYFGTSAGVDQYNLGVILLNGDKNAYPYAVLGTSNASDGVYVHIETPWTNIIRINYMYIATDVML